MEVGLLWFDDDKQRDLLAKVVRATNHYKHRFGKRPDLCFVNPKMLEGKLNGEKFLVAPNGVTLRGKATVLMHHFWLGMEK